MDAEAFSSIDFVFQCLVDKERTEAFIKTINNTVKLGDVVVDLGTGSAVMAIAAAKAGAKRVYAVEFDSYVASVAKKNIEANNVSKQVKLIVKDARSVTLPTKHVDVVIMEMLTTGIVDEMQIQAVNNLHTQGCVDENTVFIPSIHETYSTLVTADYSVSGLKFPMVQHLWKWLNISPVKKKITNRVRISALDFTMEHKDRFVGSLDFVVGQSGIINGIVLDSVSIMPDHTKLGDTLALNAPVLIPVKELLVSKGQTIHMHLSYVYSGGFSSVKTRFIKISE